MNSTTTLPTTNNTIPDTIQPDDLSRLMKQGTYASHTRRPSSEDKTPPALGSVILDDQAADTNAEPKECKLATATERGGSFNSMQYRWSGFSTKYLKLLPKPNGRALIAGPLPTSPRTRLVKVEVRSRLVCSLPALKKQGGTQERNQGLHVLQTNMSRSAMDHWQNTQRSVNRSSVTFYFVDHGQHRHEASLQAKCQILQPAGGKSQVRQTMPWANP